MKLLGTRELYQPIQSCHVVCLGISNKSVAVYPDWTAFSLPRLMLSCLSGHCNIYLQCLVCASLKIVPCVYMCTYTHTQLSILVSFSSIPKADRVTVYSSIEVPVLSGTSV